MDCREVFKNINLHGYLVAYSSTLLKQDGLIVKIVDVLSNQKHKFKLSVRCYQKGLHGDDLVQPILDHDDVELLYELQQALKKEHGI